MNSFTSLRPFIIAVHVIYYDWCFVPTKNRSTRMAFLLTEIPVGFILFGRFLLKATLMTAKVWNHEHVREILCLCKGAYRVFSSWKLGIFRSKIGKIRAKSEIWWKNRKNCVNFMEKKCPPLLNSNSCLKRGIERLQRCIVYIYRYSHFTKILTARSTCYIYRIRCPKRWINFSELRTFFFF